MKALVLAAGYATRLYPLTLDVPKQLLPVGGRPILDWIVDRIEEVTEIDEVHLVTNSRFAGDFARWASGRGVTVHDDGTTSNDDRLGAIGDIHFAVEQAGIDDHLLVVAGDNLFEFSLVDYVDFWRGKGRASAVAVFDCGDIELASHYGVVAVDDDDRVVAFVEKPSNPPSTLIATAAYLYHREHVPLVAQYLAEGEGPDQSGSLIAWLHRRESVYGYRFGGTWFDIGNHDQLLVADNWIRRAQGQPPRDRYTLDTEPAQS
jgi:glucose-1-phosphate thymidylyltransferase